MRLKRTLAVFIILFYHIDGHVSGRLDKLSLKEVISQSNLIVLAVPVGKAKEQKTADGHFSFAEQKFVVKKTIYPADFSKKEILVTTYDSYEHDIARMRSEGVNKIGIYKIYESKEKISKARILFLKEGSAEVLNKYVYTVEGSLETEAMLKKVLKAVSEAQQPEE